MSKPQTPKPVDPVVAANAQGAANEQTARVQSSLDNVNTYGPTGSVVYSQPSPDRWSQTTTLSPAEQQTYDLSKQAQNTALGVAGQQAGRVGQALGQTINPAGLPNLESEAIEPNLAGAGDYGINVLNNIPTLNGGFNQGQGVQGQVAAAGPLTDSFANTNVQGHVGPQDFNQSVNSVTDAYLQQALSRLDPTYGRLHNTLDNKLANQGIGINSAAYGNAQDILGRQENDAYNQAVYGAIGAGANEQNTLFGQNLAQGQFANQAAGQQFGQNQAQANFQNQAQAQQFGQNLSAGQFANQAAGQEYAQGQGAAQFANQATQANLDNRTNAVNQFNAVQQQQFGNQMANAQLTDQARQQSLQEQAYLQNLPINQLTALLGAGQVSMPQSANGNTSVQPTDVLGAYALNAQQQQAQYQAKLAQTNGLLGGLFSLGSAGIIASDRRLKRDVVKIGKRAGVDWYAFRYLWSPVRYFGAMAQEVLTVRPEAVSVGANGFLTVNYEAL